MSNVLQSIAGELLDFVEFMAGGLQDDLLRKSIVRDLGGNPNADSRTEFPKDSMAPVRAYRDSANPSTEAGLEALANVARLEEAIISLMETWRHDGVWDAKAGTQETARALLDLFATNYARLKYPRLYLALHLAQLVEDLGSTYGDGYDNDNSLFRIGHAGQYVGEFLFAPGKQIEQLSTGTNDGPDYTARILEAIVRAGALVLAFLDKDQKKIEVLRDVLTGWDGPNVDVHAADAPSRADVISQRMTSFTFGWDSDGTSEVETLLTVTASMIPKAEGGTAGFISFGGAVDAERELGDRWTFGFKARADAPVGILIGSRYDVFAVGAGGFDFKLALASHPPEPSPGAAASDISFSLPAPTGTRVDIGQLAIALELSAKSAELLLSLKKAALVLDGKDTDSLVSELIGDRTIRLPFNLTLGPSSARGFVVEGGMSDTGAPPAKDAPLASGQPSNVIDAAIPVGRHLGPLTVHEVSLRIARPAADAAPGEQGTTRIDAGTSLSAYLGPVFVRLDKVGFSIATDSEAEKPNLGIIDLQLGVKLPSGVALAVDTGLVTGGGSIIRDPDRGLYFGNLELVIRGGTAIKATGLIATRMPDGSKGFSLFLIVTVEFEQPYPLGMGFFLEGVGGMLAVHRTFDETAMRAALPTGQLRNVLFPYDPVHHSAELLQSIQTLFPIRRGSHMFGVLVKIGWSRPAIIHMEMGVIYEWGRQHRLILLGRVSALLPRETALLKLNMDSVGILDFDAGTFALDAVLYDSKLCDRFVLSGAMAMRMAFKGSAGFALAIGGLHPRFAAPAGFPSVARLQLALSSGDNPKLTCQCYFAITSNTVQFGSECALHASALGFTIEGNVGFDVLIQLIPFHFLAEFRASVQLKRGSHNLFKVSVSGELEGPLPLRVAGKAKFEILWCDFSVSFNRTLVDGRQSDILSSVDGMALLVAALSAPSAWETDLPADAGQLATIRMSSAEGILLHPLGTLKVRQTVVPLDLPVDIDRIGEAVAVGERRYSITNAELGGTKLTLDPANKIEELFASGQFFDMTDDERLAAPSFVPRTAGLSLVDEGYAAPMAKGASSSFAYTDIVINADGTTVEAPVPHTPKPEDLWLMTRFSAAAAARVRNSLDRRFDAPVRPGAPRLKRASGAGVAAGPGGAQPSGAAAPAAPTSSLAADFARDLRTRVLEPHWELAS